MAKRELVDQDLQMLRNASTRWRSWKVTKRNPVVASTRHHCPRFQKYYACASSLVKSRMLRPLQTDFLLFQQIFFILVCIHEGNPRVPPRVLASGPKPCGGNKHPSSPLHECSIELNWVDMRRILWELSLFDQPVAIRLTTI